VAYLLYLVLPTVNLFDMSIMEQKMQEQMEGSEHAMIEAYENVCDKIDEYIKKCNYTWTVEEIFKQYRKSKRNEYISHTAKDVVNKFRADLDELGV